MSQSLRCFEDANEALPDDMLRGLDTGLRGVQVAVLMCDCVQSNSYMAGRLTLFLRGKTRNADGLQGKTRNYK